MRTRIGPFALAALMLAARSGAEDFVPCERNRPDDAGLRIRVQAVIDNDANNQAVSQMLGQPPTRLSGSADDVDLLAWCRCVHRRRVDALGEELARSMASLDPALSGRYRTWLDGLDPQQQREHLGFVFDSEAACVNESRRP